MLVEGLENLKVSHDAPGSYSDVVSGESEECLRGPGYGDGDATAGGDRGCVCVSQYEDESSLLGKIATQDGPTDRPIRMWVS